MKNFSFKKIVIIVCTLFSMTSCMGQVNNNVTPNSNNFTYFFVQMNAADLTARSNAGLTYFAVQDLNTDGMADINCGACSNPLQKYTRTQRWVSGTPCDAQGRVYSSQPAVYIGVTGYLDLINSAAISWVYDQTGRVLGFILRAHTATARYSVNDPFPNGQIDPAGKISYMQN